MKTFKLIIPFAIILLIGLSCKKEKLDGEYENIIGSWKSIPSYQVGGCGFVIDTPINPNFKLNLYECGNYKVYQNSEKIEAGSLRKTDGLLKFIKSVGRFKNTKNRQLNGNLLYEFANDTLKIGRNGCNDGYLFLFIRD